MQAIVVKSQVRGGNLLVSDGCTWLERPQWVQHGMMQLSLLPAPWYKWARECLIANKDQGTLDSKWSGSQDSKWVTKSDTTGRNGYWWISLADTDCCHVYVLMGKMTGVLAMGCRLEQSWLPLHLWDKDHRMSYWKLGSHSQFSMQTHMGEGGSLYRPTEAGLQPQEFAFPGTSN